MKTFKFYINNNDITIGHKNQISAKHSVHLPDISTLVLKSD